LHPHEELSYKVHITSRSTRKPNFLSTNGSHLHEGRIEVPTKGGQDMIDGLEGTKHHVVRHVDETLAPGRLHHWRLEQPGPRHPAGLGCWTFVLAACWLHPVLRVGQSGCHLLPKAIREKERRLMWSQHLRHRVDQAWGHGERALPNVDRQQQCTLRVHRDPHPLGRPLQALDGFSRADRTVLDGAEQGNQRIELDLGDVNIVEKMA
jgi:hypothetical protein